MGKGQPVDLGPEWKSAQAPQGMFPSKAAAKRAIYNFIDTAPNDPYRLISTDELGKMRALFGRHPEKARIAEWDDKTVLVSGIPFGGGKQGFWLYRPRFDDYVLVLVRACSEDLRV